MLGIYPEACLASIYFILRKMNLSILIELDVTDPFCRLHNTTLVSYHKV